jgi:hypothetical protein
MSYRDRFTDEEWRTLELAPLWMLMLVGGMDKKVDRKEMREFARQIALGPTHSQPFGIEVFLSIHNNLSAVLASGQGCGPVDGLKRVTKLLEKVEPQQAVDFKASLIHIGQKIAASSGGLFQKKVSKEETAALVFATAILAGKV